MKKICKKCGIEKELKDFYIHKGMSDEHLSFCKECVKSRVHNHYCKDLEVSRKKEKLRHQRRKKNPDFIKYKKEQTEKYRSNPLRKKAFYAVRSLYKERPENCELCGKHRTELSWTLHAHHPDYNFPKIVKWLCSACHKKVHLDLLKR